MLMKAPKLFTSGENGVRTRAFVNKTPFFPNKNYTKEVKCDVDKFKPEVS